MRCHLLSAETDSEIWCYWTGWCCNPKQAQPSAPTRVCFCACLLFMAVTLGKPKAWYQLGTLIMPPKFRVWLCTLVVCVCVCETGSSREHHQHVVAADGKWFGRAETFTDSPRPVDHQHSCTWWSAIQGKSIDTHTVCMYYMDEQYSSSSLFFSPVPRLLCCVFVCTSPRTTSPTTQQLPPLDKLSPWCLRGWWLRTSALKVRVHWFWK